MAPPPPHRLIDFHSHYYSPAWYPFSSAQQSSTLAQAWPLLTNIHSQLLAMDGAEIDAKVLSAPSALITPPGKRLPITMMERINDHFAALVAAEPRRLLALATIDAFQGDVAAREAERAIKSLGMGGICVDCAQGDSYLDAPEAQPTLETAVKLGVPVFVHPVNPPGLTERMAAKLDRTGYLLARGTETTASVLALMRSGIFDELSSLNIVLPMIGAAAFLFAGIADYEYGPRGSWQGSLPSIARKRLYVDTMGFDPVTLRFAIELLGAEHVLLGSDWPIMPIMTRRKIEETLASLDLTDAQRAAILGGNTRQLLTQHTTPQ